MIIISIGIFKIVFTVSTSAFVIPSNHSYNTSPTVLLPVQCTGDSALHWVTACLIILHDTCWTCWVWTSITTISVRELIFRHHLFVPNLFVRCPRVCSVWCDDAKVRADCNTAQMEIGNEFSSALKTHFTPLGALSSAVCWWDPNKKKNHVRSYLRWKSKVLWCEMIWNWITILSFCFSSSPCMFTWRTDGEHSASHVSYMFHVTHRGAVWFWKLSEVAHVSDGLL